jgi:hypothetical protein
MFNSIFGMEAVSFQTSSQLGKDLTAVFQEVIDYRDNLDYTGIPDDFYVRRGVRIRNVVRFCNKTMGPKFVKVLEKDLGFKVKNFYLYGADDGSSIPLGIFAVNIDINAMGPDMYRALMNMTGTNFMDTKSNGKYADDVAELADCIDLHNTKLKKTTIGKNKPITVQTIYFDVMFAFCINEFVDPAYAEEFTAEELAAIMMHECGHAMTVIEHAADSYVTSGRLNNYCTTITNTNNPKDIAKMNKAVRTNLIPAMKRAAKGDQELTKKVNDADKRLANIDTILGYVSKESPGEGTLIGGLSTLAWNVLMVHIRIAYLSVQYIVVTLLNSIYGNELRRYVIHFYDSTVRDVKSNDRRDNYNQDFLMERWADEFVSRHGYGEHQASALRKLLKNIKYCASSTGRLLMYYRPLNDITIYSCLMAAYISIMWWLYPTSWIDPIAYENGYDRIKRLLQNTKGIFKEEKLPDACVYEWVAKCNEIELQMKKVKELQHTDFGKGVVNVLHNLIMDPANLFQLIKDGKLDRDCAILEDRLDDMRNNALFMMSHVFRTM